ncbi:META domain-containing protein [Pseudorhodobacter ferrugineus]|nr:META domain-containing protein [Pseudorhodobacter ferrugineus]
MNTKGAAFLGMALALTVGACVAQQQSAPAGEALAGNWQVTSLVGGALPAGASVTLDFAGKTVSGNAGCNRYSGNFVQKGQALTFAPTALTRMACAPMLMDVESGFTKALAAVNRYDMAADTLRLFVGDTLIMQAQRR